MRAGRCGRADSAPPVVITRVTTSLGCRWMRYGFRAATAALPMLPLACGVVRPPELALPVAPLGGHADLRSP